MNADLLLPDSDLPEELAAFAREVRGFAVDKLEPHARAVDEERRFRRETVADLASAEILGGPLATRYGGGGWSPQQLAVAHEEIGAVCGNTRGFLAVHTGLVAQGIEAYGDDRQKDRWLLALARGQAIGCFALTEADAGSDVAALQTRAERSRDGWKLSGAKVWITNGGIADLALIWAQTQDGVRGFLVDTDAAGFASQEIDNKLSLRASVTSALFLDDVRVPEESMLPNVVGLRGPLSCLNQARYGIVWGAVGAAQACLAEALEFAANRELFGHTLDTTQSVQIRLADIARRLSTAQVLALHLGRCKDRGTLQPTQVSLGKWNNVRMALEAARACRELLGASGITTEFQAIRHMLNLETVLTYEGTETVHQLVVGKALTGASAF